MIVLLLWVWADLCLIVGCCLGVVPARLSRTVHRCTTVLWFDFTLVGIWASSPWWKTAVNVALVLAGVWTWNRPKDDEGPPRRKRKIEKKIEEAPADWTGTALPIGAE